MTRTESDSFTTAKSNATLKFGMNLTTDLCQRIYRDKGGFSKVDRLSKFCHLNSSPCTSHAIQFILEPKECRVLGSCGSMLLSTLSELIYLFASMIVCFPTKVGYFHAYWEVMSKFHSTSSSRKFFISTKKLMAVGIARIPCLARSSRGRKTPSGQMVSNHIVISRESCGIRDR